MFKKPYKERRELGYRQEEAEELLLKFPRKIPVVAERYRNERLLPDLDKTKYVVPQDMTMAGFVAILRNRLAIGSSQTFYVMVADNKLPSMILTMAEIYNEDSDDDGFLYVTYASEEMFG